MSSTTIIEKKQYFPQFVYGSVDGIITTFAIISGSIGGNIGRIPIVILGISNILADGYSMGVSSYLSENTDQESRRNAITTAIVTFISFVLMGIVPILSFVFIKNIQLAAKISFILTSILFATVGYISSYVENISGIYGSMRTLLIGTSAAMISYYTGSIVHSILH